MSKFWRVIFTVAVLTAVMAFAMVFITPPTHAAHAQCVAPREQGDWVNVDPNTSSITRVRVQFVCQDVVLNGNVGSDYYVHLFGKCHPTDCDWGTVPARRLQSGHIYAVYNQGFAIQRVYIRMSQFRPGLLWVNVQTHFTDGRADYQTQDWFSRL